MLFEKVMAIKLYGAGNTLSYFSKHLAAKIIQSRAFNLIAQYTFLLSPREAMQLKWNRTVNTHGRPGKNVSCDFHLEHLNKEAKQSLMGIGSNFTNQAVIRMGKSLHCTQK